LLYKVSDVFSDPSNLMAVFKELGSYGDVQYGLRFTTGARALFYNKDILPRPVSRPSKTSGVTTQQDLG
jgi:hypothetical protein